MQCKEPLLGPYAAKLSVARENWLGLQEHINESKGALQAAN